MRKYNFEAKFLLLQVCASRSLASNLYFMGESNFTESSKKSREILAEFTGNAALNVLALIVEAKNTAPEKL